MENFFAYWDRKSEFFLQIGPDLFAGTGRAVGSEEEAAAGNGNTRCTRLEKWQIC